MNWIQDILPIITGRVPPAGETPLQAKARHRKHLGISTAGIGIFILLVLGVITCLQGNWIQASIDFIFSVMLIIFVMYGLKTHQYLPVAVAGVTVTGLHFFNLFFTGGVHHTGHLWFFTYPLFSCFLLGSRRGAIATFSFFVPAMLLMLCPVDLFSTRFIGYDSDFVIRFIPAFLLVFAYSFIYERSGERQIDHLNQKNALLEQTVDRLREKEASLKAVQTDLENRVVRRTESLSRVNDELQREIETRRQMQERLQRTNALFTTVLDGIDVDIFVVAKESCELLFMNQNMRENTDKKWTGDGHKGWMISGKPFHVMDKAVTNMGSVTDETNVREVQNPENGKWYLYQITEVQWADGQQAVVHVATDISTLKQAEACNRELQAQLHQARKMEAIGLMAGGVAHDLNNILTGIVSYPEFLLQEMDETNALRKPISIIKKSGEKAAAVVNDLLAIARSGITTMEIVNLNDIVFEYVNSPEHLNLLNHHRHVQVDVQSEKLLFNIAGSEVHLFKILMNLVANAAEAMPDGGAVRIRTKNLFLDNQTIGCDGKKSGEYVLLAVEDPGTGMTPEDRERIFEPFFTRKVMGRSGTGLGMTVVWQSVADHQGFIEIESTVGAGTIFRLYFPAAHDRQMTRLPAVSMDRYVSRGETVLFVDDMEDQRIIASAMLHRLGYQVVTAESGAQAIDYLKSHSVDLVVLDMILGQGLNGRQTYERILKMHPDQKAVIVSGFAENDEVRKAQKIGAGRFIKKPYSFETLGASLKCALEETFRNFS